MPLTNQHACSWCRRWNNNIQPQLGPPHIIERPAQARCGFNVLLSRTCASAGCPWPAVTNMADQSSIRRVGDAQSHCAVRPRLRPAHSLSQASVSSTSSRLAACCVRPLATRRSGRGKKKSYLGCFRGKAWRYPGPGIAVAVFVTWFVPTPPTMRVVQGNGVEIDD